MSADPIEFWPWASIPADHKRGEGDEREVLGTTFKGEPAWLPWMGEDEDRPEAFNRLYHRLRT